MKKNKLKRLTITFAVLDSLAIICLFIFYGPFSFLRDFLIVNAMPTFSHKYLARTFYSDNTIIKVLENNQVLELNENSNINDITITKITNQDSYESIYEEQVLKRDNEEDLYKIWTVEEKNYRAYIAAIYDPKKISLVTSADTTKYKLDEIVQMNNAKLGINASGYYYKSGKKMPIGTFIINGTLLSDTGSTGWGGGIIGFNNDGILMLSKNSAETELNNGIKYAVDFGPFLIVNGKKATFKGISSGKAPRTAIAQRRDGVVLMVASDGRGTRGIEGMTLEELADLLLKYGAYNASNLDGGNSSVMYANGEFINNPSTQEGGDGRKLPNAWIVK